jgi:hypothetical protein
MTAKPENDAEGIPQRLKGLRKKAVERKQIGNRSLAGAKALTCFVAFAARLKSCPCYKACMESCFSAASKARICE